MREVEAISLGIIVSWFVFRPLATAIARGILHKWNPRKYIER